MSSSSSSSHSGSSFSNVDRFLLSVTPDVPSRTLNPQSCSNELNSQWIPQGKDTIEYFMLKDLWDCYEGWSAMGAGTPLMLESGDTLMNYYVPYLSAIQIYSTKSVAASRNRREDGDAVEFECDSWSDDSASDKLSRSLSNNSSKAWDAVSLDSNYDQVGSWPTRDTLGYLYLDYTETSRPCWRVPFSVKITELAKSHPALMTLKSVDISPASWMAVAWYPIYSIPNHPNEKDIAACFLTYHTLSSSFQDCTNENGNTDKGKNICCSDGWGIIVEEKKCKKGCISVSPFGLATYKMKRNVWLNSSSSDHERVSSMYSAADSWLKQLNAYHHDFNFFTSQSTM